MKKTAIITGASRGIGRATAELFAANNYNVIINYNHSADAAFQLYHDLRKKWYSVALFKADVTNRREIDAMTDYCLNTFGAIDLLINNAGIAQSSLFIDLSPEDWEKMIGINLTGVFHCTQSVLGYMISRKKGKIINISSIWGQVGASCEVHYSAAKAGVIGLTKALAKELGPSKIQVNCIAPGIIETDMLNPYNQEELASLADQTPLERLGTPSDIATCALFLASEQADYITGQVIGINGGFVI
jgi:3-oxoacyl-[acyl-carrier protein] reductase